MTEPRTTTFTVLVTAVPAVAAGVLYELYLGHRHDYVGHFAAGYGGTLSAMMVVFGMLSKERFARWSTWGVVPMCLACILLGGIAEATAFRVAKFDEIDFCNQSIGAVLAGISALAVVGRTQPADKTLSTGIIVGIIFLSVGACFAVA